VVVMKLCDRCGLDCSDGPHWKHRSAYTAAASGRYRHRRCPAPPPHRDAGIYAEGVRRGRGDERGDDASTRRRRVHWRESLESEQAEDWRDRDRGGHAGGGGSHFHTQNDTQSSTSTSSKGISEAYHSGGRRRRSAGP